MAPSRPIAIYDISSEARGCLQYLYSSDTKILCGSVKLGVLTRLLARMYGPSIIHPGLRHAIIALLISKSGTRTTSRCPTQRERLHVDITFAKLARRLSNPIEVDESDIFAAYILAIWSIDIDDSANTEVHIAGVIAIMRHLSQKLGSAFFTSPMAPFWALLRDEILWLTRKSDKYHQNCREFRDVIGPKTIQQRLKYESELRGAIIPRVTAPNAKIFFGRSIYTSVHTMIQSARIIDQLHQSQVYQSDPLIESIVVELHIEQRLIEMKGHQTLLDLELKPVEKGEYVKDWRLELTIVERIHDLIVLYVCRLATIALEAPSIEYGLGSSEGVAASTSLISLLQKARAFFLAGIEGGRVFGTGT